MHLLYLRGGNILNNKKRNGYWFWKWILNTKVVTSLLIVLLLLLILICFTKISYLFKPILQFFSIVGIPIIVAIILYYFLVPVVDFLERHKVKRGLTILLLFIIILGLLIWGGVVVVPKIQEQIVNFINNLPGYFDEINQQLEKLINNKWINGFRPQLNSIIDDRLSSLANIIQSFFKDTLESIGSLIGTLANVFVVILTVPFLLFYLLKDGKKFPHYATRFLPTRFRKPTLQVLKEMNEKVSQYIRGQLIVAMTVLIMFIMGFSIIGLDFAVSLGIIAGFLNLLPYLGSFIAMIPVVFLALVSGPTMLLKVMIVFFVEQTIEGRLISPLILGSKLNIHPVTIIFVLLTSGKIFGVLGIVFGIPIYAALKVLITYIFEWYKKISKLYQEDISSALEKRESSNVK
ncbi:AI-2E family transporter [Enterococcus avium]|uniref:AI-2E family transporter n=1 Tax=Enterococcus avium TaxID=33945 RepID=A0A8B5W3F8_ENTAV|nr:AI-2E family transporter [Enterococcus avium]TRZ33489.1 AI-2E family transporter [Enterococcus avium]